MVNKEDTVVNKEDTVVSKEGMVVNQEGMDNKGDILSSSMEPKAGIHSSNRNNSTLNTVVDSLNINLDMVALIEAG